MAEYIERERTVELLRSLGNREYRKEKGTIQDAIKMISYPEYTPAADVAPVVRCKDCKYYKTSELLPPHKFCFRLRHPTENRSVGYNFADDDFCSHGERR